jgi:predicted signal transduction protein with EAL and GGDEF domain
MAHIDRPPVTADGIRVRAADLRDATRKAAAIRAAAHDDNAPVYLDIEVLIQRDTASAFTALAELPEPEVGSPNPLRYIGTPRGLAGLIADVQRLGIADAVVLMPLAGSRVADLMLDELSPGLGAGSANP